MIGWPSENKPVSFYDDATAARLKREFAAALLRNPHDAFAAAREIEPVIGRALWIADNWAGDPEVIALLGERKQEMGARAGLPEKDELAARIYSEATAIADKTTRLTYYRTVAELLGYIEKGNKSGVAVNLNNLPTTVKIVGV